MDGGKEDLKVAYCSNAASTEGTTATLDSDWDVGGFTSITIGADGLGLISYNDHTNIAMKVPHYENVFCLPHFRKAKSTSIVYKAQISRMQGRGAR